MALSAMHRRPHPHPTLPHPTSKPFWELGSTYLGMSPIFALLDHGRPTGCTVPTLTRCQSRHIGPLCLVPNSIFHARPRRRDKNSVGGYASSVGDSSLEFLYRATTISVMSLLGGVPHRNVADPQAGCIEFTLRCPSFTPSASLDRMKLSLATSSSTRRQQQMSDGKC